MSHHHSTGGFVGPPDLAGMRRVRSYTDGPVTSRGLPVRSAGALPPPEQPQARAVAPSPPTTAAPDRLRAFADAVLGMHRVLTDRFIPMCSCGMPARHCQIVKAEHDVLGIAMPFEFGPLARPLYYEV